MSSPRQVRDWLSWLVKVRILVITFLLGIELVIRNFVPSPVPVRYFLSLILVAYAVAVVGAAAMGAVAEKPETAGRALIFVGLAEGIAIYGLIIAIMILGRLP